MYDPAIGRWTAQDPLSEKYYSYSAYNYCVNNPVMFVDPDGKKIVIGTVWEESFPSWAKPAYFKKYQNEVQSHLTELKQYNNEIVDESTTNDELNNDTSSNEGSISTQTE